MNTEAIKAYAQAAYRNDPDNTDIWESFDDNWDINVYHTEFGDNESLVHVAVFPVIDKQVQSHSMVYYFTFQKDTNND